MECADRTTKRVKYFTVWSIRDIRKKAKDRPGWHIPDEKVLSKVNPAHKFTVITSSLHGDGVSVRCTVYMSANPEIKVLIDVSLQEFESLPTCEVE